MCFCVEGMRSLGKMFYVCMWVLVYMPAIVIMFCYFWYLRTLNVSNSVIQDALLETLKKRDANWPNIQYTFKCCGVESYKDYSVYSPPDDSCCQVVYPHCAENAFKNVTIASHLHQNGCIDYIRYKLNAHIQVITFPVQIMSLVATIVLLFASVLLYKYIKRIGSSKDTQPQHKEGPIYLDNAESDGSDGNETIVTNTDDDELILTTNNDINLAEDESITTEMIRDEILNDLEAMETNKEDGEDGSELQNVLIQSESNESEAINYEVQIHIENSEVIILESDDDQLLEP